MIDPTVPLVIGGVAVALLALGAVVDDRRARRKRDEEIQPPLEAVLPLLHSINDDRCIGCEACIDVCPTEVLELVEHKVRVVRFSDCVQCEQCQNACPTTALVMYREGTTPRMLTVPELDEHFQTGTPGQYLIGEVAGKPLVKNAANLGRAVVEHIARQLEQGRDKAILDVVIVGSGPGGLSAGLTCLRRGLSCVVLEKEHVISSTVARYPKGKHFMAEPSNAINASFLPVFDASKEELVAAWKQVVDAVKLPIKLGEAVENVKRGDDGVFVVKTTVGTYRARRVVLATGLRGKPRLLAVPGANLEKVQSLLDDPGEFAGLDVLVVGGGDSAVEGAMSLADVGARVVLSYRGDGFKRCKQGNQKRLAEMTAAGKLEVLLESNVKQFTEEGVDIKLKDGSVKSYPNQRAFVLIGADTPVAWLETNNVRFIERPHLYTLGASDEVVKRLVPDASECPRSATESIALVLGQRNTPVPAQKPHRVRNLVAELRDEFRDAVHELSGVFKVSDIVPPPRKKVGSRTEPTAIISPQRLTRARTNVERARTNADWTEQRTFVGPGPLRPRSHKMPPPPPRRASIGFDTSDLAAFDGKLPFQEGTGEVTKVDKAFDDEHATIVDGRRLRVIAPAEYPKASVKEPRTDLAYAALRATPLFAELRDELLKRVVGAGLVHHVEVQRDRVIEAPPTIQGALCLVIEGQISLGVFDAQVLAERSRPQRDAIAGEQDGTLMPPGPLARTAKQNLALFRAGELFNLEAIASIRGDDTVQAFSLAQASVLLIGTETVAWLAKASPGIEHTIANALALTNARLRMITGIKHELLDFYVRNGLSVAGPTVRVRQLDLCIDCKQCEDACEERHGSRRLTLGGFELGLLDFVFTCRTCADARCLTPCEHDAIKRDARTGEIQIVEDRCIGCSLCALSCPYGAIDMVNVAEPEMPSFNPVFKARLEKGNKLAFGAGKGRKAPARRIANKCDHCAGYADQACVSACPTGSLVEIAPAALFRERAQPEGKKKRRLDVLPLAPFTEGLGVRDSGEARVKVRKLSLLLWVLGLGAFAAVLAEVALRWYWPEKSVSYYVMTHADHLEPGIAKLNVSYLAGTTLALTCGYVGTALMVLSMAYLLQRRFGWFKATASNQFWLDVHLMTGIVGPLFIVLHSAMRLTTWVSIPFWSMVAVVISGVIGRYLYTLVPAMSSKHELAILDHRRAITELSREHAQAGDLAYQIMEDENARSERAWNINLIALLFWVLIDDARHAWLRWSYRRRLRAVAPPRIARQIARRVDRVVFLERRNELAPRSKALLKSWKKVHIPFSVVLLVTMLLHIALALHLA